MGGLANITSGAIGYVVAQQTEWRYFHESNLCFGLINTSLSAIRLHGLNEQSHEKFSIKNYYGRYLSGKNYYLLNAGLDLAITTTGMLVLLKAPKTNANQSLYYGVGRSLCLQGISRLIIDNILFAAQVKNNSKWYDLIYDLQFVGNGISLNYRFK